MWQIVEGFNGNGSDPLMSSSFPAKGTPEAEAKWVAEQQDPDTEEVKGNEGT